MNTSISKSKKDSTISIHLIDNKLESLFKNPKFFSIFMLIVIFGILIYYKYTKEEFFPFIILGILWIIFWNISNKNEHIMLVVPSLLGYFHELMGVKYGYFTYLNGIIGGAPIWLIPGYGAIFWSSYHMWNIFYKKYNKRNFFKYINHFILLSFILLMLMDFFVYDLAANPIMIMLKFFFVFLLFIDPDNIRLAYFVAFFTVLTELTGEFLGTWYHPEFSIFSLMSGYIFLLWICLTVNKFINKQHVKSKIEILAGIILSIFYILLLFGKISV